MFICQCFDAVSRYGFFRLSSGLLRLLLSFCLYSPSFRKAGWEEIFFPPAFAPADISGQLQQTKQQTERWRWLGHVWRGEGCLLVSCYGFPFSSPEQLLRNVPFHHNLWTGERHSKAVSSWLLRRVDRIGSSFYKLPWNIVHSRHRNQRVEGFGTQKQHQKHIPRPSCTYLTATHAKSQEIVAACSNTAITDQLQRRI